MLLENTFWQKLHFWKSHIFAGLHSGAVCAGVVGSKMPRCLSLKASRKVKFFPDQVKCQGAFSKLPEIHQDPISMFNCLTGIYIIIQILPLWGHSQHGKQDGKYRYVFFIMITSIFHCHHNCQNFHDHNH